MDFKLQIYEGEVPDNHKIGEPERFTARPSERQIKEAIEEKINKGELPVGKPQGYCAIVTLDRPTRRFGYGGGGWSIKSGHVHFRVSADRQPVFI